MEREGSASSFFKSREAGRTHLAWLMSRKTSMAYHKYISGSVGQPGGAMEACLVETLGEWSRLEGFRFADWSSIFWMSWPLTITIPTHLCCSCGWSVDMLEFPLRIEFGFEVLEVDTMLNSSELAKMTFLDPSVQTKVPLKALPSWMWIKTVWSMNVDSILDMVEALKKSSWDLDQEAQCVYFLSCHLLDSSHSILLSRMDDREAGRAFYPPQDIQPSPAPARKKRNGPQTKKRKMWASWSTKDPLLILSRTLFHWLLLTSTSLLENSNTCSACKVSIHRPKIWSLEVWGAWWNRRGMLIRSTCLRISISEQTRKVKCDRVRWVKSFFYCLSGEGGDGRATLGRQRGAQSLLLASHSLIAFPSLLISDPLADHARNTMVKMLLEAAIGRCRQTMIRMRCQIHVHLRILPRPVQMTSQTSEWIFLIPRHKSPRRVPKFTYLISLLLSEALLSTPRALLHMALRPVRRQKLLTSIPRFSWIESFV